MFRVKKSDNGSVQPWEYMAAAAGTYKAGQALSVAAGVVAPQEAALATTPPYICQADITVEAGGIVPVCRVSKDRIYAAPLTDAAAAAVVGTKLRVSAGGLGVDAGADGSFEVTYIEDTAAGAIVQGRFL